MDRNSKQPQQAADCHRASCRKQSPLHNEKTSVPGQQIGLYNDAAPNDVSQMVRTLNSVEEQSQKDRG